MSNFSSLTATLVDHPVVRFSIKLTLDAFIAVSAWVLTIYTLGLNPPFGSFLLMGQFALVAMLVNVGFQLSRQHYRFIGRSDLLKISFASALIIFFSWGLAHITPFRKPELQFGV